MVLRGRFNDLLRYLREIEDLPWSLSWERLVLHSTAYPQTEARLVLATLGMEEAWLGI